MFTTTTLDNTGSLAFIGSTYICLVAALRAQRTAYLQDLACRTLEYYDKKRQQSVASNKPCSISYNQETNQHTESGNIENLADNHDDPVCPTLSAWRVHNLLTANEHQFEALISMQSRGLLYTYGIPSISKVLRQTGGFEKDVKRRYADMDCLIREFNENAPDGSSYGQPERARLAIQRLNAIHGKYGHKILYRDMLYVLSVFAITPSWFSMHPRWSWRPFTREERECCFLHWMDIGRQLNLDVDKEWSSFDDCLKFKQKYEEVYMIPSKDNVVVTDATLTYFLGFFPAWSRRWLGPLCRHTLSPLMEGDRPRLALGLPAPPNMLWALVVDAMLTCRAYIYKFLVPPWPLLWLDRRTGHRGYPVGTPGPGGACPMMYYPTKPLSFGNDQYTPLPRGGVPGVDGKGYILENMGPRSIPPGEISVNPKYADRDRPIFEGSP